MAKTNAPLLSMGGTGQIGKTMVHATWRGVPYVRKYVKPSNPNSAGQQSTRSVFSFINGMWKLMGGDLQAPWIANAAGRPYTGRNQIIKSNLAVLRAAADLDGIIGSPGALGGLAPNSATASGGAGEVGFDLVEPSLPTGWAISKAVGFAISQQDPHTGTNYVTHAVTEAVAPWNFIFSGLDAGDYVVCAWFEFTRSDGKTAYGPSLSGTATAT